MKKTPNPFEGDPIPAALWREGYLACQSDFLDFQMQRVQELVSDPTPKTQDELLGSLKAAKSELQLMIKMLKEE